MKLPWYPYLHHTPKVLIRFPPDVPVRWKFVWLKLTLKLIWLGTVNLHIRGPLWQTVGHPFSLLLGQPNSAIKAATLYCPGRWPTVCRNASGRHWAFLQGHSGLEMTWPLVRTFSEYISESINFSGFFLALKGSKNWGAKLHYYWRKLYLWNWTVNAHWWKCVCE